MTNNKNTNKKINLLEATDLRIAFGHGDQVTEVVHGLSFSLSKGEILGIVGESGSGKTVTGLSILKLLSPQNSSVSSDSFKLNLEDEILDLNTLRESAMQSLRGKKIAMIFQEPMSAFNPVITCGNQVIEVLTTHTDMSKSAAKALVLGLFKEVELPDPERAYRSYPHQLSGGQLQRIMIAMAISCSPALIIADEPTTALDVTIQQSILDLLKSLNVKYGLSLLFISHDLGIVANLCDRVLVMRNGVIVESGTAKEIFNNPKDPYTQGLIACRPTLTTTGHRLPELADYLDEEKKHPRQSQRLNDHHQQETLLVATDLVKRYKNTSGWFSEPTYTTAVDTVSLTLKSGEVVGLVGESGCGKTTLSNLLLGLDLPDSGEITYLDKSLADFKPKDWKRYRKSVQVVFQNPYSSLNPKMRIGRIIKEPMDIHHIYNKNERKDAVLDLLSKVGLPADAYDRFPSQFSGGQRQRIVIARALASQPKLVICDESVSALDVSIQASIINLLLDLKDQFNLSYLFISHDLRVIKFVSDRVLVMQSGKIIESGLTEQIFNDPQQDYTASLINSIPTL